MQIRAFAKVNLALDVVERMDNGYHSLDMIMAPISLYDEIEIEQAQEDRVTCLGMELPVNNTITKMIHVLREEYGIQSFYRVNVIKHIPAQAGLAGGSADAASVCGAILEMENISLTDEELYELGKKVGADVPFCLYNKWARVKGIGEIIEPICSDLKLNVVIVKPNFGISTPLAFSKWRESSPFHPDVDLVQLAIQEKNMDLLYQTMANSLEPIAFEIEPELNQVKMDMEDAGLVRILMSGSGSSMLGFSVDEDVLIKAYDVLKEKYDFVKIVTIGG